ncbi:hypothetical protein [Microcoleus sp. A2-D3]|uniref:hypothetical protein n=1 Tax=unclassified Microcoleus TaxID=2642155 RepID=UPI003FA5DB1E
MGIGFLIVIKIYNLNAQQLIYRLIFLVTKTIALRFDKRAIAQILQQAHQKGEDIGDLRVLKRYHNWRKKENLIVLGFTDFLDRLFSNTWLPIVAFRRFGLWCLRKISPVRFLALRLMTGLMGRPPELAQN